MAGIGSTLQQAHTAAGPATTAVVAAAGDEVSAAVAALFSRHGQVFQAASAQAAQFHAEFAQTLGAAGGAYAAAEAAAINPLQTIEQAVSTANQTMLHDISVPTPTTVPLWQQAEITAEKAIKGVINEPTELTVGRPLIGNGATGTAAHPDGFNAGRLDGNGGRGGNGGSNGQLVYKPILTAGDGGNGGAGGEGASP